MLDNVGALARAKHGFLGWTNAAGTTLSAGQTFFISNENVVLYAKWDADPMANAGTNFKASLGTPVTLNGSGS